MNDNPHSVPYCTADYLKTPQDIAAYLNAVLEEEDAQLLRVAINDVALAIFRQPHLASGKITPLETESQNVGSLLAMLHALDLEMSIQPRRKST